MSKTLLMKFGGTSVGNPEAIRIVAEIVRAARGDWPQVAVVVSAMNGVTDALLTGAHLAAGGDEAGPDRIAADLRARHEAVVPELISPGAADVVLAGVSAHLAEFQALCHAVRVLGEASPRALDAISSLGERMSAPIVAAALEAAGVSARAVDASRVVVTDAAHQLATPDMEATQARAEALVLPLLADGVVPVITGFLGGTPAGVVTTLGRGGATSRRRSSRWCWAPTRCGSGPTSTG
jgi:aspartate kinase